MHLTSRSTALSHRPKSLHKSHQLSLRGCTSASGSSRTLTCAAVQATKRLSLLTIGEIGRTADLSGYPNLRTALTEALGSSSEDIKSAASTALGAVCIGNLGAYMPFLLQQIQALVGHSRSMLSGLYCSMLACLWLVAMCRHCVPMHRLEPSHCLGEDLASYVSQASCLGWYRGLPKATDQHVPSMGVAAG